ncbi:anthranilate 1,2-dioxygenase small subunit [Zobellella endophytica]|uniref:Anthranilate 1,2-dioxygenase small subunit n=1 Tax=Zobellella endophytica TaxID=2116700 RepID=A0A2P7R875_9GAMM|nr:anthranilate 1,2-dioxygenase small subunit [Zobellella endophytica]PSJ46415.1 anthranilate 1,2-dioxygenase small subunit [Zobellella endophytica]
MEHQQSLEQFFYRVAEFCDNQDWDNYLEQFAPECEFHIPQWDSEHSYTQDPKREMSLMYYPNRGGIEDRVFRIRTGKSAACTPMPRTLHLVNNLRYRQGEDGRFLVKVNWVTHYYRFGESHHFFGTAHYRLRREGDAWKITYKQSILLNDRIDSVLDFYHV